MPRRRLTPDDVADIRAALSAGASVRGLARRYSLYPKDVRAIRDHEMWKSIAPRG